MLAIKIKKNGVEGWINWWIGMSIPKIIENERVITFQADGDELALFLDAMNISAGKHPTVTHTKQDGFSRL